MSAPNTALSHNGGRYMTRGWTGAKYIKRQTAKRNRKAAREAIRQGEGDITRAPIRGWAW